MFTHLTLQHFLGQESSHVTIIVMKTHDSTPCVFEITETDTLDTLEMDRVL